MISVSQAYKENQRAETCFLFLMLSFSRVCLIDFLWTLLLFGSE